MKRNVGGCDRMARVCVGFMLMALGLLVLGGLHGEVWGLVVAGAGALALVTGLIGFCPLYVPLGISTAGGGHWMGWMMAHCSGGQEGAGVTSGCCGPKSGDPASGANAVGHGSRA
jgi:DUF2892 family protein